MNFMYEETIIRELLGAAEEADEVANPYPSLMEGLRKADRLVDSAWTSAEAHYLRGYALYLLWSKGFSIGREVLAEMDRVLLFESDHDMARFHAIILSYHLRDLP